MKNIESHEIPAPKVASLILFVARAVAKWQNAAEPKQL